MAEIPESLLRRSAEAKAKALGLPVEQVLAEMKGEAPPSAPLVEEPAVEEPATEALPPPAPAETSAEEAAETLAAAATTTEEPEVEPSAPAAGTATEEPDVEPSASAGEAPAAEEPADTPPPPPAPPPQPAEAPPEPALVAAEADPGSARSAIATEERPPSNGAGNGARVAATISPRPVAPPANAPEGIRTQRLLTVVKAKAIQQVKAEPTDKVSTWPHLMIAEFTALMAMTAFLLVLSVIIQSPLLDPANFNSTPNPSKAPWYFLGLQELLSYFDPQIAGVTVPTIVGMIGFMMVPYVDRNPSTRPSDRKFAIMLYTMFLAGSATLTIIGVLFRGRGFNFSLPWKDGVFFDDLKDWVSFE